LGSEEPAYFTAHLVGKMLAAKRYHEANKRDQERREEQTPSIFLFTPQRYLYRATSNRNTRVSGAFKLN
jgi:hypothetical protein